MVLEHIQKLLFDHDCVIMPDFGGLITHYEPAKIHPVRYTFSPPAKRVAFNEKLKINDGLLISTLAYDNKLSTNEAQQQVTQFVQELQRELNHTRRFDLKGIGIFRLNEEGKIIFEYVENENYLSESFGLPELLSKPVIASEPVILRTLLKEQPHPRKSGFRGTIHRYYRAATALMIGGVIVTGLYLLSVQTDYNVSAINPITLFQTASQQELNVKEPPVSHSALENDNAVVEVQKVSIANPSKNTEPATDSNILIASENVNNSPDAKTEVFETAEKLRKNIPESTQAISNPKKLTIAPGEAVLISAKAIPAKPKTKSQPAASVPKPASKSKEIKRNFTVDEINAALSASGTRVAPETTSANKPDIKGTPHPEKKITLPSKIAEATGKEANTSKPAAASTIKPEAERFYVIVNGYSTYENAERNRKIIAKKGRAGQIIAPYNGAKLYRIAIAEYSTRDQAIQNLPELKNKYGNSIWILKR